MAHMPFVEFDEIMRSFDCKFDDLSSTMLDDFLSLGKSPLFDTTIQHDDNNICMDDLQSLLVDHRSADILDELHNSLTPNDTIPCDLSHYLPSCASDDSGNHSPSSTSSNERRTASTDLSTSHSILDDDHVYQNCFPYDKTAFFPTNLNNQVELPTSDSTANNQSPLQFAQQQQQQLVFVVPSSAAICVSPLNNPGHACQPQHIATESLTSSTRYNARLQPYSHVETSITGVHTKLHPTSSNHIDDTIDRREQRKIRNREAAQLSRMRRKEMVDIMQSQLDNCRAENDRLRAMNTAFQQRITDLQRENEILRQNSKIRTSNMAKAAGVCILVVVMLVSVDTDFITKRFSPIDDQSTTALPLSSSHLISIDTAKNRSAHFRGRSLLSVADYDQSAVVVDDDDTYAGYIRNVTLPPANISVDCGDRYVNQTESIRLNNVLTNWVDRHERLHTLARQQQQPRIKESGFLGSKRRPSNTTGTTTTIRQERKQHQQTSIDAWRQLDDLLSGHDQLANNVRRQQFKSSGENGDLLPTFYVQSAPSEAQYDQLARALRRRQDTLYVVSMKDYMLLPATARNNRQRPRITLIVPALAVNASYPNQTALMRIECEVVGTSLFHLADKLFASTRF